MKLAYISIAMPAASEEFISIEVNGLRAAGVEVSVFCLRGKRPNHELLLKTQKLETLPLYHIPYVLSWSLWCDVIGWLRRKPSVVLGVLATIVGSSWRRPGLLIRSLILYPKSLRIARLIEREGITVLHAAWGHFPAMTAYLARRLMPQVRYTISLVAYDRLFRDPMTVISAESAECIVTEGHAIADLLRTDFPRASVPVHVIRRGINIAATRAFRDSQGSRAGLIVSIGRLSKRKGHQYIIAALPAIRRTVPEAELLILGEGTYREQLEQQAAALGLSKCLHMPGHMQHGEMFRSAATGKVFVLATETDNLPNAIKEAMSLGLPVVTTPTTGIEELIQDGVTGCIVPHGDVPSLAARITEMLTDQALADRLKRAAMQLVDSEFDIVQTTARRKQLYESIQAESGEQRL